jgi:hypothetical protein
LSLRDITEYAAHTKAATNAAINPGSWPGAKPLVLLPANSSTVPASPSKAPST